VAAPLAVLGAAKRPANRRTAHAPCKGWKAPPTHDRLEGDLLRVWPNLCHPSSTLTHTLTREAEHVRWRAPTDSEQAAIDHETYCTGQATRDISRISTFVYPMSWADLATFLAKLATSLHLSISVSRFFLPTIVL